MSPVSQDFPLGFQVNDTPNITFQDDCLVLFLAVTVDQADLLTMIDKVQEELLFRDHPHVDSVLVCEVGGNIQLKAHSIPECSYGNYPESL